jgi:hypothetical protein
VREDLKTRDVREQQPGGFLCRNQSAKIADELYIGQVFRDAMRFSLDFFGLCD